MLLDALVEHALTGKEDGEAMSAPAADLLEKIDQAVSTKVAPLAPTVEAKKGRGRPRKQAQPKVSPGHSGEAQHVLPQPNTEKGEEADGPMNAGAKAQGNGAAEEVDEATRRSSRRDKAVFKVSELLKPRYRAPNKSQNQQQQEQQEQEQDTPSEPPPAIKKRGRPFKNAANAAAAAAKKAAKAAVAAATGGDPSKAQEQQSLSARKRGRPRKNPAEASAEHFPQGRSKRIRQQPQKLREGEEAEEDFEEEEEEEDGGDGYYKEEDSPLSGTEGLQIAGDGSFEGRRMELLRWRMSLMAMMKSLEMAEANLARDMAAAAEKEFPEEDA